MTIVQLEYLLGVASCGSFSLAAERCFVTQPSLSMQIKNLEDELGVVLLDRTHKPVVLTEAGKVVVQKAREAIKAFHDIRESVKQIKGEVSGTLRLGIIPTIAPYLLHRFIPDFTRLYPLVELEIKEMTTGNILDELNKDTLDVAIMAGGAAGQSINEETLFEDRFYAYIARNHPLTKKTNIEIDDIDLRKLLLLSEAHCLRSQVLELCHAKQGLSSQLVFECGSIESLVRMVDSTNSMTIIPEMSVRYLPSGRTGQLRNLCNGAASRPITIATHRTFVKRAMVNALKESIINCYNTVE